MSNFELIDDYLTDKLNEQDRKSFEQQMISDPALKADVELQKEIIQGLKAARIAELKAMLNKIPVASPTIYFSPLRIAAGLIGTAVLATGLYFYFDKNSGLNPNQASSSLVDSIRQTEQNNDEIKIDSVVDELKIEVPTDNNKAKGSDGEIKKNDKAVIPDSKENKPVIDLIDPTDETTENEVSVEKAVTSNTTISVARIEVNVISSERKLKSHYQFAKGKLILYGNFDNGIYEIIEVNAEKSRSLFLYYKTSYFLLDDSKKEVTPLKEISDPVLVQKLNSFRSN